jgi:hypothetical protein
VEITQVAGIVIAAGMRVDDLAQIPLSFPTLQEYWLARRQARPASSTSRGSGKQIQ